MIVFDLKCAGGEHVFEAWFGSSASYEDQRKRALIACPICGDTKIGKALMAPNIGSKGNTAEAPSPPTQAVTLPEQGAAAEMKAMMSKIATLQAESLKKKLVLGVQ